MEDRERFDARRVAAIDQARAGVGDLTTMVALFYRQSIEQGVPRRLARTLTRDFLARLTTPPS
jgi:hypothetical protein